VKIIQTDIMMWCDPYAKNKMTAHFPPNGWGREDMAGPLTN